MVNEKMFEEYDGSRPKCARPFLSDKSLEYLKRKDICNNCEFLNKIKICKKCGCLMLLKIRIDFVKCPIEKW